MATSCKRITCEVNACRESYESNFANRPTSKVVLIVGIMTCVLAIFVTPVDSNIVTTGRRTTDMISQNVNLQRGDVASAASHSSTSRRNLQGRSDYYRKDYLEFLRYLHKLSQVRQGAKVYSRGNTRRHLVPERSFRDNTIAKDLKCGQCKLKKEWIPVSKPGCKTNFVLAPICSGLCETWEIPDIHPPYVTRKHHVCRPAQVEYRKINLQQCKPGVNNQYVIAMAKSCACMKCRGTNTSCRPL